MSAPIACANCASLVPVDTIHPPTGLCEACGAHAEAVMLWNFDHVVINSSGGKDSLAAMHVIDRLVTEQDYPRDWVTVSHQHLGESEWPGVLELVHRQAARFGWQVAIEERHRKDGTKETLLEYAQRRGMWPSQGNRWCTSDFKRAPGARVVTALNKDFGTKKAMRVLYVFGFRAQESPARAKRSVWSVNPHLTVKRREVIDWLPVHHWTAKQVWAVIRANGYEYHPAYDLGMPRLSCVFCIYAPKDALVVAGRANPELLDKYARTEAQMGHRFQYDLALADVQRAIAEGYEPKTVKDWDMH